MSWDLSNICTIEGCWNNSIKKGWCNKHYLKYYKTAPDYKPVEDEFKGNKRKHPLYMVWFERKQGDYLCAEWLDFSTFLKDVSPKPEGYFFLVRPNHNERFGPNNFEWKEKLFKREGETNKEWWSRKRAARIKANPSMERDRNLKRAYNLTATQYQEKLKSQNFVCAICGKEEVSIDSRTGARKRLAVDHNHKTKVIRDLLCWRCNTTIGKIDEDLSLVKKIEAYLIRHNGES